MLSGRLSVLRITELSLSILMNLKDKMRIRLSRVPAKLRFVLNCRYYLAQVNLCRIFERSQ